MAQGKYQLEIWHMWLRYNTHRPRKKQANQWFTEPGQTAFTNALGTRFEFHSHGT
jgi:hypothetical protein